MQQGIQIFTAAVWGGQSKYHNFRRRMLTGGVGEHVEDLVLDVFQRSLVVRDVDHLRTQNEGDNEQ